MKVRRRYGNDKRSRYEKDTKKVRNGYVLESMEEDMEEGMKITKVVGMKTGMEEGIDQTDTHTHTHTQRREKLRSISAYASEPCIHRNMN
jgi:hypothetical protein